MNYVSGYISDFLSYYICFFLCLKQYHNSAISRISKLNEEEKSTGAEDVLHLRNEFWITVVFFEWASKEVTKKCLLLVILFETDREIGLLLETNGSWKIQMFSNGTGVVCVFFCFVNK